MDEFDDDFGDLYSEVEVQPTSAINTVHGFPQLIFKKDEIFDNVIGNCCYNEFSQVPKCVDFVRNNCNNLPADVEEVVEEGKVVEEGEGEGEKEESSDSEDELNIVLNDDDGEMEKNWVINDNVQKNEFAMNDHVSNRGGFDYKENEEIESCKNAMEQNSDGGKFGSGYNLQYKNMRYQIPAFPCDSRAYGSSAASYSSKSVQDELKDDGYICHLNASSLASQSGFNYSLPRSRTILDVDIGSLKSKPWSHPGANITDYFNFGFNENSWKQYCNRLNTYRYQISGGRYSCQSSNHYKDLKAGTHEEVSHKVGPERIAHPVQLRSGMISGRAIQVEECATERQPSTNTWGPLDRDSSVVIQIAVQDDMKEDCLNSTEEGEDQTEVDNEDDLLDEAREILCFSSASEDELSSLEGDDENSVKSVSESGKSCRQSPTSDSVSKHPEIDHGSGQILDANVFCLGKCTDAVPIDKEMDTSIKSGASTERRLSDAGPSSISKPHLNHGDRSPHSVTRPNSHSHRGYECGTYANLRKSSNKSKFDLPNSLPAVRDSATYGFYNSEDSERYGVSSEPRDHAYCSSSRSALKPDLRCNGNKPVHMDNDASHLSDKEWFADSRHSTIYQKHNGLDSYYGKRNSYCKTSNSFPDSGDHKSSNYDRDRYMKRPNWKGSSSEYDLGQNDRDNMNGKKHFEQKPRLDHKEGRQGLFFDERRHDLKYIESQPHGGSRQWQSKYDRFLDNEGGNQWKTEKYDCQFSREFEDEDLLVQSKLGDHRKPVSYVDGVRDYVQHKGDKHLSYSRREVDSSDWSKRRCDRAFNGHDDEQYAEYDDDKGGCSRLWSRDSQNRPRSNCRQRLQGGSSPRDGMDQDHPRKMRNSTWAERSYNNDRQGHYSSFDTDVKMRNVDNQDSFLTRRDHDQCGVSRWNDEHYKLEQKDNEFLPGGPCYPHKGDPSHKNIDSQHGPNLFGNHMNRMQAGRGKFKMTRGHKRRQFFQNFNVIRNDNHGNALPRIKSSVDSHLVGVDRKFSGRSLGGRNTCNSRYEYIDDDTCMKLKTFGDSEVDFADKAKFGENFEIDANKKVGKQHGKFSRVEHNDSEDIEEGQVVTEEFKERAKEEMIEENARDGKEAFDGHNNPKIREILAKMERRRERFNQPIALKKDTEKASPMAVDTNTETCNSNSQRPARKRRWDGTQRMLSPLSHF